MATMRSTALNNESTMNEMIQRLASSTPMANAAHLRVVVGVVLVELEFGLRGGSPTEPALPADIPGAWVGRTALPDGIPGPALPDGIPGQRLGW